MINFKNILDLLKRINSSINFDSVITEIVNVIREALNVERCSLFIVDKEKNLLWTKVAQDLEIEKIEIPLDRGLVGYSALNCEVLIIDDAYSDERFYKEIDKITGFKTKNLCCYPLKNLEGEVIAVIQTINKKNGKFTNEDIELLDLLSQHLVIALNNSIYFKQSLEKKELETELTIAKNIQQKFLPHHIPDIDNIALSCKNIQCNEIGGDYYDFFDIDHDRYLIVMADVSGHGISSALLMTYLHAAFHLQNYNQEPLNDILFKINNFITHTVEMEKYVTAFVGILNVKTYELFYCCAGHLPGLVIRNKEVIELNAIGIPLGMFENVKYEIQATNLRNDDMLFLYTDGVIERKDEDISLSLDNLKNFLLKNKNLSCEQIIEKVISEISLKNSCHIDDITLLCLKLL